MALMELYTEQMIKEMDFMFQLKNLLKIDLKHKKKYLHLFEQNEKTNLSVIIFKNTPKKVLIGMFNIEDN